MVPKELTSYKILFIDDKIDTLTTLQTKLSKSFNIDFVKDAQNALDLIKSSEEEFAIIVSDIFMPDLNGIELLKKIREISPNTIPILITGEPCLDMTIEAINEIEIFKYITKPIRFNLLKKCLEDGINKYISALEIRHKSIRDSLTKLYNHIHILQILEKEIIKAKRYNTKLSILLLDLDYFKEVNDTFGHRVGDRVLVGLSACLKNNVRNIDYIGRYGGDEFLIVFPNTDIEMAYNISERIRVNIENIKWEHDTIRITISGGLVELEDEELNELVIKADKILYQAKANGKNCIIK
jgi:diguanylate cyclase (GGDEF)-like protein